MLKRIRLFRFFKIAPLFAGLVADAPALFSMLRSVITGKYKMSNKRALLKIGFALCYIFLLTDFIPDFLPFIGWLDDITVAAWAMHSIKNEIEDFRKWQAEK